MPILPGRYGRVSYDPTGTGGATLVEVLSINAWNLSEELEFEDISCYGDTNRVWLPGLIDISGELSGFWNSDEVVLWKAAIAPTPGLLSLLPNDTTGQMAFKWEGKAWLDASIDCSMSAPTVSSKFKAAGSWTTPGTVTP